MKPDPALAARLLHTLAPWRQARTWYIALSGGLDSTVLLHLLAHLAKSHDLPTLQALHVHHGLQAAADAWPMHCQAFCDELGVPLQVLRVRVAEQASVEGAAREARYQALGAVVGSNELLLTAQHADDQAETLLFRLLRGAGVRGAAAMPVQRPLGAGYLVRALLEVSRAELERYARDHGLRWVEDPTNGDQQLSRNYLRHEVFPRLTARWPRAVGAMARSAAHFREAQGLLDDLAELDLATARPSPRQPWLGLPVLALAPLAALSPARQRNALRHWLAPLTRLPDAEHWAGWESLRDATEAATPLWALADGQLHRADAHLWWLPAGWQEPSLSALTWARPELPLVLPGNGELSISGQCPSCVLQVRYREGGEVMQLPGRGRRDLKRLLNEQGVPPFLRGRLPLVYREGHLVAVANLPGLNADGPASWNLHWQLPKSDQGLS